MIIGKSHTFDKLKKNGEQKQYVYICLIHFRICKIDKK